VGELVKLGGRDGEEIRIAWLTYMPESRWRHRCGLSSGLHTETTELTNDAIFGNSCLIIAGLENDNKNNRRREQKKTQESKNISPVIDSSYCRIYPQ
jgi:hypothetical protein